MLFTIYFSFIIIIIIIIIIIHLTNYILNYNSKKIFFFVIFLKCITTTNTIKLLVHCFIINIIIYGSILTKFIYLFIY